MNTTVDEDQIGQLLREKFISKETFSEEIEKYVSKTRLNYIDAIVEYCNINDIEVESVAKLITKPLKERLRQQAIELNYLPQTTKARLPI